MRCVHRCLSRQEPVSTNKTTDSSLDTVETEEAAGFALQVVDQCTKCSKVFTAGVVRTVVQSLLVYRAVFVSIGLGSSLRSARMGLLSNELYLRTGELRCWLRPDSVEKTLGQR